MKKTMFLHNHGWTYVETIVSVAIFAIIVISISIVVSMTSKTSVTYKKKVQVHQFAQAIIEDLRKSAKEDFAGIKNSKITYNAFMNGSSSSDIVALLNVAKGKGSKKVGINISWMSVNGLKNTTYYSRISPRGLIEDGGIAKGKVLYIAHLDADHRIPTDLGPEDAGGPDEIYSEAKKDYYAGAGGVTVKALSNNEDGTYVIVKTNDNGEFLLKNIKVDPLTKTTIYFYKEGSEPNSYGEFEQAYYFFDKEADVDGVEIPCNARGLYKKEVLFPEVGYEEDIGVIVCAKAWNFYVLFDYRRSPTLALHSEEYKYPGSIKVSGDVLRWGIDDSFQAGCNYWDVTEKYENSYFNVFKGRGLVNTGSWKGVIPDSGDGIVYSLSLHNLRGAYAQGWQGGQAPPVSLTFEFKRFNGSEPNIPNSNSNIRYGILKSSYAICFNPVNEAPFGPSSHLPPAAPPWIDEFHGRSQLVAPTSEDISGSGYPIKEHTQDFHNTLNLIYDANDLYWPEISPRFIRIKTLGALIGYVRDTDGNPLSNFLVGYYTDAHDGTKKNYYTYTKSVGSPGRYELNNVIDELNGVSFSKTSEQHDYLYTYGVVSGTTYYGLPDTVNGLNYNDTSTPPYGALARHSRENRVDFVVYDGVNIEGKIETVNPHDPPIQFKVYMRRVLGWNDTISTYTELVGGDVEYSFTGNNIKRSVHDTALPIRVRSISPGDGVSVYFDITVQDDTFAPVTGANVIVTQHNWEMGFDSYTDVNGKVYGSMMLPLTHEMWTVIPKTGTGPFQVDLTIAAGHAIDDEHSVFLWVRVEHEDYETIDVLYDDSSWIFSSPVDPEGIPPDDITISNTICLTKKATTYNTINFSLTFSHKDELKEPPDYLSVHKIIIDDFNGEQIYDISGWTSPYTFMDIPLKDNRTVIIRNAVNNAIGQMDFNNPVYLLIDEHNNNTINIKIGYATGS